MVWTFCKKIKWWDIKKENNRIFKQSVIIFVVYVSLQILLHVYFAKNIIRSYKRYLNIPRIVFHYLGMGVPCKVLLPLRYLLYVCVSYLWAHSPLSASSYWIYYIHLFYAFSRFTSFACKGDLLKIHRLLKMLS